MSYYLQPASVSSKARQLAFAQNKFGFALLQQLSQQEHQAATLFLSPFSVAVALSILLDGTAGTAHTALAATLGVAGWEDEVIRQALVDQLRFFALDTDGNAALHVVNSFWTNLTFPITPTFVAHVWEQYQAKAASLDMVSPAAADLINKWVSQQTAGLITHMVEATQLTGPPPVAAMLLSTVYFKGLWESPFQETNTRSDAFQLFDGDWVPRAMMQQTSSLFSYQQGENWVAVRLPYEGSRAMHMNLFVPDTATGLPDLLASLTTEKWQAWQEDFTTAAFTVDVNLTMPRFEVAYTKELVDILDTLGLGPARAPQADFTPMGFLPVEGGFIGSVRHKAYLKVDEEGTEAAAVTAIMVMQGAGIPQPKPTVEVRVERPFLCAITDAATGVILFAGAIYDPTPIR